LLEVLAKIAIYGLDTGIKCHHNISKILISNCKMFYKVAQNKIPHRRICNISVISGLILKILEAA